MNLSHYRHQEFWTPPNESQASSQKAELDEQTRPGNPPPSLDYGRVSAKPRQKIRHGHTRPEGTGPTTGAPATRLGFFRSSTVLHTDRNGWKRQETFPVPVLHFDSSWVQAQAVRPPRAYHDRQEIDVCLLIPTCLEPEAARASLVGPRTTLGQPPR